MKKSSVILAMFCLSTTFSAHAAIPFGNGTWTYDSLYNNQGKRIGFQAGLFAQSINDYNAKAIRPHKITQIFSYGGDMEMYCQGSGGSKPTEPCNAKTLQVFYDPGIKSTAAYFDKAQASGNAVVMFPIVDGVVGGEYLKTFNKLDRATANLYADIVAKKYCADDHVFGVQFDLEPFDLNQPGQAYFFAQIAKNFAGKNNPGPGGSDPLGCVNAQHREGRFFSVFTYSGKVTAKLADIFNQFGNGFVIDSLYDLGSNAGGQVTSPSQYAKLVASEVTNMMNRAKQFNVKYQFGIPGAASVHEFEWFAGKSTGYQQLDYVKAAINAINSKGARNDNLFLGVNIWGWNHKMFWQGKEFRPSTPKSNVLNYLATTL